MRSVALVVLMLVGCSPSESGGEEELGAVHEVYLDLIAGRGGAGLKVTEKLHEDWELNHTPMLLETIRFTRNENLPAVLMAILKDKTGKRFGDGLDPWLKWLWNQEYEPYAGYAEFKSTLYGRIDPKFAAYFDEDHEATIRLDEVRWGGVRQDGIPPLRKPKMLDGATAEYLGESDVVFGIEVNGEARAYPKRILAWHEMFVDTIEGIELAGVY